MAMATVTSWRSERAVDEGTIRPSHVNALDAELTELRGRIHAIKSPKRATVTDASQRPQLAMIQALVRCSAKCIQARCWMLATNEV
jgi:hypothetical protein